jgi:hypothetical protein
MFRPWVVRTIELIKGQVLKVTLSGYRVKVSDDY